MTFYKSPEDATKEHPWKTPEATHCHCCAGLLEGALVAYDVQAASDGLTHRILMHRDCAFAMAQRIICDAWPNRRSGTPMANDR